jgi:hypothetical protein
MVCFQVISVCKERKLATSIKRMMTVSAPFVKTLVSSATTPVEKRKMRSDAKR